MTRKLLYQERSEAVVAEESKKQFLKMLEKKFDTTIIGSIYHMEELFGHLWGFNSNDPLTKEQKEWYKLWQELRNIILNNGNGQKRMALKEAAKFNLVPNRFRLEYVVQTQQEEGQQ